MGRTVIDTTARQWVGQPVYILLKDGNYYIGMVKRITKKQVILADARKSTQKGRSKQLSNAKNVQISGFLGSMLGAGNAGQLPFGGIGAGTQSPANTGGFFGTLGKAWPMVKVGIGMIQTIWPLFRSFKI
ncbi:hypothetical protein O9H85_00815 [Paenibacillus filicis]|uniref:Uncharacterized protein n=1 Tax=Paenibacillus gyeongsangnamensis TaxID=3388067 RepID=A0ABT4Q2K4_9BACL|nr:hypothetical protein [Paenibacillus filicis]MCZ8510997.1 hypothetical protein [Paenibacillus filicis]